MLTEQDRERIREVVAEELLRQQVAIMSGTNGNGLTMLKRLATEMAQAQEPIFTHVVGLREELCELVAALDKLSTPPTSGCARTITEARLNKPPNITPSGRPVSPQHSRRSRTFDSSVPTAANRVLILAHG